MWRIPFLKNWWVFKIENWVNLKLSKEEEICKKETRKLNAVSRIIPYMDISRRKILMNAFFKSHFNYCALIWMCCNRSLNHEINRIHERCLRMIYSDKKSSFDELLDKNITWTKYLKTRYPNVQNA